MLTVDFLKEKLGVKDDKDLADILGKTPGAISNWRKSGIPAIVERKAIALLKERGISELLGIEDKKADAPAPALINPVTAAALTDSEFLKLPIEKQVALVYQMMRSISINDPDA
jgi:hypothetical protein